MKDATDLVDLVSSYLRLERAGARWRALCPFHEEKTASFYVNPATQLWHCFGCNRGGDVLDFVQEKERLTFPEALELLARKAAIELRPPGSRGGRQAAAGRQGKLRLLELMEAAAGYYQVRLAAPAGARARSYLASRGIRQETSARFRLGWAGEGWSDLCGALQARFSIAELERAGLVRSGRGSGGRSGPRDQFRGRLMIPIDDVQGQVVGFGGRVLDQGVPKYINTAETELFRKRTLLFGLWHARQALHEVGCALLVEGYTDVILAHQAGVTQAVATLGTALSPEHGRLLKRHVDRVLLFYDGDEPGQKAAERSLGILLATGLQVSVLSPPAGQDPGDYFSRNGREEFEVFMAERSRSAIAFQVARSRTRSAAGSASVSRTGQRAPGGQEPTRTDPDGVVRAGHDLVQLLKQIEDPIQRELATREGSDLLGVSEGALVRALQRGNQVRRRGASPAGAAASAPGRPDRSSEHDSGAALGAVARAEREILAVVLRCPELAPLAVERLHGIEMSDARTRRIMQRAGSLGSGEAGSTQLLDLLRGEADLWSLAMEIMGNERDYPVTDPERVLLGAAGRLRSRKDREACQQLRSAAVRERDRSQLDDRMRRFVEAQRRLRSQTGPGGPESDSVSEG